MHVEKATVTLDPGRYCGGLWISASTVTLNPGLYIIDGGDFIIDGGSSVTGAGVTFVLTATDPANIGNLTIAGGTTSDLSAPTNEADPYAGVLVYQDRLATSFSTKKVKGVTVLNQNSILGGASTDLQGSIYFPSQEIRYAGGAGSADGCTQVIGRKVTFAGNANILNDEAACEALRVRRIELLQVTLLE